jgi:hypothetical protein
MRISGTFNLDTVMSGYHYIGKPLSRNFFQGTFEFRRFRSLDQCTENIIFQFLTAPGEEIFPVPFCGRIQQSVRIGDQCPELFQNRITVF